MHLDELFDLRRRFFRSVEIERDVTQSQALDGYVVTALGRATLDRISQGVLEQHSDRAWTLTGPYGTGKSAFALFLTQLLGAIERPETQQALRLLKGPDKDLERRFQKIAKPAQRGYCRILVGGMRGPLLLRLHLAIRRAVDEFFGSRVPREIAKLLPRQVTGEPSTGSSSSDAESDMMSLLAALAAAVVKEGGGGVLLVIDELGKFLEFASSAQGGDIFILQRLAEMAARSEKTPILVLTMLHQAFERYALALPAQSRDEWAKVQGRFDDIAFIDPPAQILYIAGQAIQRRVRNPEKYNSLEEVITKGISARVLTADSAELLRSVLPLNPVAATILPALFRGTMAQHERSLFSFLTARQEGGFAQFLATAEIGDGRPLPTYRVDALYDYLVTTLGAALYVGPNGKRWAEIEHCLGRIPAEDGPLMARLLKTIGVLMMFGGHEMRPTTRVLALALVSNGAERHQLDQAIQRLLQNSLIVYRKHSDSYALWEGSDIDLDERFQAALTQQDSRSRCRDVIRARLNEQPKVARRHFFETGTLRCFDIELIGITEVAARCAAPHTEADGRILLLLPEEDTSRADLVAAALRHTKRADAVVVAIPTEPRQSLQAASEFCAWQDVRQTVAELAGDPVARKELGARIAVAQERLEATIERVFGFGQPSAASSEADDGSSSATSYSTGAAVEWFCAGRRMPWSSTRDFLSALSDVCARVYGQAPLVHNELLNRRILSSSASSARRSLLHAMVTSGTRDRLGIDGYPPEYSMYVCLFERGGIHAQRQEGWTFGPPSATDPLRLRPTWDFIQAFLSQTEANRKPVKQLYEQLALPPFGIRDGLMPVLFLAAILPEREHIALFEEGTYVLELNEAVLDRLQKRPERFEVERLHVDGRRAVIIEQLADLLPETHEARTPLAVVRALCQRVNVLPTYVRNTRQLSPSTLALRDAIFQARDPLRLLFHDLPQALGLASEPLPQPSLFERSIREPVRAALSELASAYPDLLRLIESHVAVALDIAGRGQDFRRELAGRAHRIANRTTDLKLRGFIARAQDESLADELWLESIATLFANRPPAQWFDADLNQADVALLEISRLFLRAEEIVHDTDGGGNDLIQLMRISVAGPAGPEHRRLVRLRQPEQPKIESAERKVTVLLHQLLGTRSDLKLTVLGRLAQAVMAEMADPVTERGADLLGSEAQV